MIRHMLECWFWSLHVGFQPEDAVAWFRLEADPGPEERRQYERNVEKVVSSVVMRFRSDYPTEIPMVERADELRKAMHKGAHVSGHLLNQLLSDDDDRFIFGANYRSDLAVIALSCGLWTTIILLLELNNIRPQPREWQHTLGILRSKYEPLIPVFE